MSTKLLKRVKHTSTWSNKALDFSLFLSKRSTSEVIVDFSIWNSAFQILPRIYAHGRLDFPAVASILQHCSILGQFWLRSPLPTRFWFSFTIKLWPSWTMPSLMRTTIGKTECTVRLRWGLLVLRRRNDCQLTITTVLPCIDANKFVLCQKRIWSLQSTHKSLNHSLCSKKGGLQVWLYSMLITVDLHVFSICWRLFQSPCLRERVPERWCTVPKLLIVRRKSFLCLQVCRLRFWLGLKLHSYLRQQPRTFRHQKWHGDCDDHISKIRLLAEWTMINHH